MLKVCPPRQRPIRATHFIPTPQGEEAFITHEPKLSHCVTRLGKKKNLKPSNTYSSIMLMCHSHRLAYAQSRLLRTP